MSTQNLSGAPSFLTYAPATDIFIPKETISDDVLLSEAGGAEEEKCVDFPRLPEEQEVWLSNMRLLVLGLYSRITKLIFTRNSIRM